MIYEIAYKYIGKPEKIQDTKWKPRRSRATGETKDLVGMIDEADNEWDQDEH